MSQEPEVWRRETPWWRRPWVIVVVLVVTGPWLAFIFRRVQLAQVADAPEPFDLIAASRVDVAPGENAFEHYQQASAALGPARADGTHDPEQNVAALQSFLAGSELPEALYHQPGTIVITTRLDLVQNLRGLARLAEAEAERLEKAGDPAGAWTWHRATFRASRHVARHGPLIQRLVGSALHDLATERIVRWSANPGNDAAALRRALADVRSAYGMTLPLSETLKVEYLVMSKTLDDPQALASAGAGSSMPSLQAASNFVSAEPAMSHGVLKLAFANYLSQCDKPRRERTVVIPGTGRFFDVDRRAAQSAAGLSPEELERVLQKAPLARQVMPAIASTLQAHDRERARQSLLELALVLQIRYREAGSFPPEPTALVGPDLEKVPIDPCGLGEPIRYRIESRPAEGVTIWSIGEDGVDDDGRNASQPNVRPPDIVIQVKPPAR